MAEEIKINLLPGDLFSEIVDRHQKVRRKLVRIVLSGGILAIPPVTRRCGYVWRRNLTVFIKTWKVNFFPPFIEAFLYLTAIGLGIGTYVREIGGIPYVNFIAPPSLPSR